MKNIISLPEGYDPSDKLLNDTLEQLSSLENFFHPQRCCEPWTNQQLIHLNLRGFHSTDEILNYYEEHPDGTPFLFSYSMHGNVPYMSPSILVPYIDSVPRGLHDLLRQYVRLDHDTLLCGRSAEIIFQQEQRYLKWGLTVIGKSQYGFKVREFYHHKKSEGDGHYCNYSSYEARTALWEDTNSPVFYTGPLSDCEKADS